MAQTLNDFSPQQVGISWGGVPFTGYAEDTFVTVSRNTDNTTASVGADGSVGITKNADKTGTIEVTLMQTSETHRILSAIQLTQDQTDQLYRANMTVTDPSGGFIAKMFNVHIQTPPEVSLGSDQNPKTWTFYAERIDYVDVPAGFAQAASEVSKIDDAISGIQSITDSLFG